MKDQDKKNPSNPSIEFLRKQKQRIQERKGKLAREIKDMDVELEKIVNAIGCLK